MGQSDVCFVEIATRDVGRAQAFFAAVFDWTFVSHSDEVTIVDTGVHPPGALVRVAEGEARTTGMRALVEVRDCLLASGRAELLGGRVRAKQASVLGGSRAVVIDPWDNEIVLIESPIDRPQTRASRTHPFRCLELAVTSVDDAVAFHQQLFGWEFTPVDSVGREAHVLSRGPMMVRIRGADPELTRRGSLVFVSVDDLKLRGERIERAGGRVVHGPIESLGEGSSAIVLDPEGSPFALMRNA